MSNNTQSIHCTLTDTELITKAEQCVQELIKTGGKAFTMQVPARPNADTDLILSEVVTRFKNLLVERVALKDDHYDLKCRHESLENGAIRQNNIMQEQDREMKDLKAKGEKLALALRRCSLSMTVHPDYEPNSEFRDRVESANEALTEWEGEKEVGGKIKIPELKIEVEDIEDFNSQASEMLEEFCIDLSKKDGMCRSADPEQDSFLEETCFTHIWMDGASALIRAEQTRLYHIGEKYFGRPNLDLDIETSWFREP